MEEDFDRGGVGRHNDEFGDTTVKSLRGYKFFLVQVSDMGSIARIQDPEYIPSLAPFFNWR